MPGSSFPASRARLIVPVAAVSGGLLLIAGQAVQPLGSDASTADLLASMHDHHDAWQIGTGLQYLAGFLLLGSLCALLAGSWSRWPRLARAGGLLLALALTASFALAALQLAEIAMAGDAADRDAMVATVDRLTTANPPVTLILASFLVGLVFGTILLAVASWRHRLASRVTTVSLGVAGIADAAAGTRATETVALALLALGLVGLTLRPRLLPARSGLSNAVARSGD